MARGKGGTEGSPAALAGLSRVLAGRWWLAAMLVLGASLRVGYVLELRGTPWFDRLVVDPEYYDQWAQQIAGGDWLGTRAFYMDPLYPYLLGLVYRLGGRDLLLARLFNVACSVGAAAATALLGRRVGGPVVGGLAALGFAVYEPDLFNVGELDKTALSMLLVATFLLLASGRRTWERAAAGVVLGLAILTRANLLVFVPLGALVFARDSRRAALLFLAGVVVALAPVALRNHAVSGEWVLTTTQLGQNFYTGNNPENPYGAYGVVSFVRANPHFEEEDFHHVAEDRAGRTLTAGETSWFWLRAAFSHMANDPGFALRAFGRKAMLFWNDFEISDSQDQYLLERESRILRLPLLGFGAVLALAALGVVAAFRSSAVVRRLTAFVLVYWLTLVAFFLFARYRIQIVPALLPLAGLGVVEAARRQRAGEPKRLASALAIVGGAAWLSFHTVGLFTRDHPNVVEMRLRHYASVYLDAGQPERAMVALQEAIPHCTHGCPWALADLFALYRDHGRRAEGVRYFERFVREHPEQGDASEYLATLRNASDAR
ncbi:MAG: glycosyltransferase family 39 protein [Candidatus Binatia bacterium]